MYNLVMLHVCCSVGVTDMFEVHILIDEIQLRESCCDFKEQMLVLSENRF